MASVDIASLPGLRDHETPALIAATHVRLMELLRSLDPPHWDRVTVCDPWTVKDVVSHLSGTTRGLASPKDYVRSALLSRGYRQDFPNPLDALNHAQVEEGRPKSPDQLMDELEAAMPKARRNLRLILAGLGPLPLYVPFLGGLINVRYLAGTIFLRDLLLHRLDIADATGKDAFLSDADAAVMLDMIKEWTKVSGAAAELHLTGTGSGDFVSSTDPTAIISGDTARLIRILAGRADKTEITIEGDADSAERWLARRIAI